MWLFCTLVDAVVSLVFIFWCVFAVAGTGFSFPYLMLFFRSKGWPGGNEILHHMLIGNDFISPLFMKLSLARYEILG